MFQSIFSGSLLIVVIGLIILRPRNLNIAWPAGIGAVIAIVFGLIPISSVKTVFFDTWDASLTLIALFILSESLNSNKFFDWVALHLAHKASGSGWKLYILVLLLTTLTTAFLANDGAILILTPIFATLLKVIYPNQRKEWLPYLFAAGFFADAMSATFVPSNLTNIILADAYHLSFVAVLIKMAIPMVIAFFVGSIIFGLRFKNRIETPYSLNRLSLAKRVIKDWFVFWAGIAVLATLIVGYIVGGQMHIPVAVIALPLSLFMIALVHIRKLITVTEVIRLAPWNILIYALGMFIVITAAYNTNTLNFVTIPLSASASNKNGLYSIFFVGSIVGMISAVVNNLPATLISILALKKIENLVPIALYAILLGVNIGPKLTPFGSLSTLLWLGILEKNGINISWGEYIKENWWVTILVLIASLSGLYISSAFI
jgi:arsenical pump membrane protein